MYILEKNVIVEECETLAVLGSCHVFSACWHKLESRNCECKDKTDSSFF